MTAELWSVVLTIIVSLIGGIGPVYLKRASVSWRKHYSFLFNKNFVFGTFFYAISVPLFIIALRGGEVSTLYPITSTGYVWTLFFSRFMLGEKITRIKVLGIGLIVFGVSLIGFGL